MRKAKGFYSGDGERSGSTVHAVIASVATGTPQYRCTQEQVYCWYLGNFATVGKYLGDVMLTVERTIKLPK